MTEMLLEDTELTSEQLHLTTTAMKAGKQLQDILTNMLNFAQLFKGEVKEVITQFHISDIIDHILEQLSTTIGEKNLQISTEIDPTLYTTFKGNQDGIYNVLSKLIDNAIKFTEQGQLVIRVQPIHKPTDLEDSDVKSLQPIDEKNKQYWIRFEISDTGIGIAEKKQAYLFDIFSQVDSSSTRSYDGMGMGLAVAKLLTESMGGQIGVNSKFGQSSTFWVNVPLEIMK
jgi:signal transduction histidine kinase